MDELPSWVGWVVVGMAIIVGIVVIGGSAYMILGGLGVIHMDVCKNYPNPEKESVSTEVYFDIPSECVNQTQLFPDEQITLGNMTYIYHEMPEMGAATISAKDTQGPYVFVYTIEKAMYLRGRYVINSTHNRFLKLGKVIK